MSNKKERMAEHIRSNVNWFMRAANIKVIPYSDLNLKTFNTAKSSFAWDAEYEDVVCLISTSVMEDGKCGALFTTECVYTKAWVPFGLSTAYKCDYWEGYFAEFSNVVNDFDIEKMQELLSDLFNICCEEDEKEQKLEKAQKRLEKLGDIGQAAGGLLLLGMATTEVIAFISDLLVATNNEKILDEIKDILSGLE